tara:strand:+ start:3071 stop:3949 length:879 start_codon:yes stop_codon:yes gene_type:complete
MISKKDLCIENDYQKKKLKNLVNYLKKIKNIPVGIQISHSGRKGSSELPWIKYDTPLKKKNSWKTYSASELRKDKGWPKPKKLSIKKISQIIKIYKQSAINSKNANFDLLELHMAHGYLLHQFLSPISNQRSDYYGGTKKNRLNFVLEIASTVRKVWPKNKVLGARITASDHLSNGIKISEAVNLCKSLDKIGFDYVCVSSGGIQKKTGRKFKDFFRAKFAKKIKKHTNLNVGITGLTNNFKKANGYIKKKYFDFIFVGRPFLKNPFFLFHDQYIKTKKFEKIPSQYERSQY